MSILAWVMLCIGVFVGVLVAGCVVVYLVEDGLRR